MNTCKTYSVLGALFLGAVLSSCSLSQQQADAYNNLVTVAGALMSEEDAAKLAAADALIGAVVTVEQEDCK